MDAAKKGGEAAVGVVARNSKGVPILLQTDPVSPCSPLEAELLAVLRVVRLAIARGGKEYWVKVIARRSKMSFTLLQNAQIGSFCLFFCRSLSCLKLCLLLLVLGSLVHVTVWLMH